MEGKSIVDVIVNTNTVLILLAVGTIIWAIRQALPEKAEKSRIWKVILRLLPICLGVGMSMVPQLRPMDGLAQCAVVGGVAGSLSASTYGIIRELFGEKIKLLMGSRAARNRVTIPPEKKDNG
jgi:hypothetical protein